MALFFDWSELQFFPLDKKYDLSPVLHITFENFLKYATLYLSTFSPSMSTFYFCINL